nr:trypsin-like peptidase domain-containing protein [Lachnospiraceae bacterium]
MADFYDYDFHDDKNEETVGDHNETISETQETHASVEKEPEPVYRREEPWAATGTERAQSHREAAYEKKTAKEIKKAEKKQKSGKGFGKKFAACVALGLVFGLTASLGFQAVNIVGGSLQSKFLPQSSQAAPATILSNASEGTGEVSRVNEGFIRTAKEYNGEPVTVIYDVAEVAENVMPSIVSITNKGVQEVRSMFYGRMEVPSESAGSGIILGENDTELLIMTNNHVVEGSKELSVGFIDNEIYEATIKGTDAADDLAVIAVLKEDLKKDTLDQIAIADIGDSTTLKIGQPVVAIGNALGYGQSVTAGIVSALNRETKIDNISNNLIQTDAAINPGNSGGALLNLQGQVVGINSAKFASAEVEGMGYAIPISEAMPILEELMNRVSRDVIDEKERGYLGIANNIDLPQDYADALGIPKGVYITEVIKDSPAEKAGLIKGDVLKKFDGITVTDMGNLKEQMQYYKAGETVEVVILRSDSGEYKEKTVKITLGTKDVLGDDATEEEEENEDNRRPDQKEIEEYEKGSGDADGDEQNGQF